MNRIIRSDAIYSASQNTPQLAAWIPSMWQNLTQRGNFRNAPSACGGDRKFQGFASLLSVENENTQHEHSIILCIMSDKTKHKMQPNSRHCFVCGLENLFGLQLRFFETGPGEVTAEYTVPEHFQGYPGVVHGGIVTAMLDEVSGRAQMNDEHTRFMYTAKLEIRFRKNVPVGTPLRVVGKVEKSKTRMASSTSKIFGPEGDLLAEAKALLVDLPEEAFESVDLEALGWKVYEEELDFQRMSGE